MHSVDEVQVSRGVVASIRRVCGALFLVALAACGTIGNDKVLRWEEEVALSGGERIVVKRTLQFERGSAPFNPLRVSWGIGVSTIVVVDGPRELVGARYRSKFKPILIDRDPNTRDLVAVGALHYCGDGAAIGLGPGEKYAAWRLDARSDMQRIPIPEWAWGRFTNLWSADREEAPSSRATAEETKSHNQKEPGSKRTPAYFYVLRSYKSNC